MRKAIIFCLAFVGICNLSAQNNLGFHSDNYSGVYSLNFNPAEIVDSRYRFQMNVFSLSQTASNNYLGLKRAALFSPQDSAFSDPNFDDNYVVERLNGHKKAVYQNLEIGLPLSFMLTFGKKKQQAIGLNIRTRTNVNANGIDERTARQAFNELDITELYNISIQNKNFSLQATAWNEFGVTYGREFLNTGEHYLKAAGTLKITQGLASAYFYSDNADVVFTSDSTMSIHDTDIKFGYSEAFSTLPRTAGEVFKNIKFGFGTDFGAVYEYRPKHADHKYEMNGDKDYDNPTKNKYLFKAGFSVIDLGYTDFTRARGLDANFYANVNNIVLDRYFSDAFQNFGSTGLQGFNDTLVLLFDQSRTKKEFYRMPLPTRINIYADYNIWKGFYANFTASLAPGYLKNPEKTRAISEFSLTPRYEHKWFACYLPMSVNAHGNYHFGLGLRLGPLVIGTYDITPLLGKKTIYDANFYTALSVPIYRSLKDRDKDHVSKKFDECKKEKGTWATKGCPDKDLDGIADSGDKCPDVAGSAEFNGCPDTDGDKIIDSEDKCPTVAGLAALGGCPDKDGDKITDAEDKCPDVAGLAEFGGCPDKDGDKIIDSEDKCPDVAGLAEFNGCPDTDGDKIIDSEDKCPDVAGLAEFNGCPDKDGDATPDYLDACPDVKGPKDNKGCPYPDTDGDTVLDKDDDCPSVFGLVAKKGCPEIKENVKKVLELAFVSLEFETGKAVIRSVSFPSLKGLAKVLKENPEYKLKISGHTDNVGVEAENLRLSAARAEAVKTFLVKEGIDGKRLTTEGFGSTRPIGDNKRSEGRKKNRRVEMTASFTE